MNSAVFPYHTEFTKLKITVPGTVFLSRALAWFESEGEFTRNKFEWEAATGLTYSQQKGAREKLVAMGILNEVWANMPRRIYFSINKDVLDAALRNA